MKTIVVIPTYNEARNILPLVSGVLSRDAGCEVIVVDDDSPDGTAGLVKKEEEKNPRVHLLLRTRCRGRGLAGVEGFRRALAEGAERVIEMDGDFSHDPRYIPELIRACDAADVAIGSRYMEGGRDAERGAPRRFISAVARRYLRAMLGVEVGDPTSGYRCFRREALEAVLRDAPVARGPFIIAEILYICSRRGMRIVEVPISFHERRGGESKLRAATLFGYLVKALKLRLGSRGSTRVTRDS